MAVTITKLDNGNVVFDTDTTLKESYYLSYYVLLQDDIVYIKSETAKSIVKVLDYTDVTLSSAAGGDLSPSTADELFTQLSTYYFFI